MLIYQRCMHFCGVRVADALFLGDPENKGFAQVWVIAHSGLDLFLHPDAFDEVRNRNRMC